MNDDGLIPPTLREDIQSAILELDSLRKYGLDRDTIVWAQIVLTACAELIELTKPECLRAIVDV